MKRKIHRIRDVFKIKKHLYKIAPKITNIDVKVSKLPNGLYKSKIFVKFPTRKNIVSTKKDESLITALDKAKRAVIKQIQKEVKPKIKRHTIRKIDFVDAA